jgi:nitrate reductase NapE component
MNKLADLRESFFEKCILCVFVLMCLAPAILLGLVGALIFVWLARVTTG